MTVTTRSAVPIACRPHVDAPHRFTVPPRFIFQEAKPDAHRYLFGRIFASEHHSVGNRFPLTHYTA